MTGKRTRYSADFKTKVALEALRDELTTVQLAAKHGIHQTLLGEWKRQGSPKAGEADVEKLHAKIGQLVVQPDFLDKASGR